ncbi:hypothetical protein Lal_00020945 [Lupinus albus]|nr:hypothetical protein Lal_00020945 [Lupinus albus]
MSDANESEAFNIITSKFLNSLATSGLPNHKIKLKSEGLCNDTRLVVTKMTNNVLEAKIMSEKTLKISFIFLDCQCHHHNLHDLSHL